MDARLKRVHRTFIISIVGLVTASLCALTGTLLMTNAISYDQKVSASHINSLTDGYPEVMAYLASQKEAEPHFETIATLLQQDQERRLGQIILIASIPIIVVSALVAYMLARQLLRPVSNSFEAQDRFIQDAAHELRNPLAALSAAVEASASNKSPGHSTKTLETVKRQTDRLISITEDLLFLQKAPEGASAKVINISNNTAHILEKMSAIAADSGIDIITDISNGCKVKIMQRDYEIIARNLIENAIKYSEQNSKVRVGLHSVNNKVLLTVSDNGIGIPESEIHKITKRFYRGSNSGGVEGSGLGLALVQKIIDVYDAQLTVTSSDGRTTFVVAFKSA